LAVSIYDPSVEVPREIIEAALKIERYFQTQGIDKWELCGIASRDFSRYDLSFVPQAVLIRGEDGIWNKE
jgi:hypothetical protein